MKKIFFVFLIGFSLVLSSCKSNNEITSTKQPDNIISSPLYSDIEPFIGMWELVPDENNPKPETLLLLLSSDDIFMYSIKNDSTNFSEDSNQLTFQNFSDGKLSLLSKKQDKVYSFIINDEGYLVHTCSNYPDTSKLSSTRTYKVLLDH
ncbi:hypothetical protein [Enterococcus sp. AZ192]|uniref:hypothetical protein n=1 Tax=unclassified Enterococcus TaxID=2608891 RepID=UPI003D2BDDF0